MKWLSVKKYTPPSCTDVFIRAIWHDMDNDLLVDRYFVGMIANFLEIEELHFWEIANGFDNDAKNFCQYHVTHFAIIDPVRTNDFDTDTEYEENEIEE